MISHGELLQETLLKGVLNQIGSYFGGVIKTVYTIFEFSAETTLRIKDLPPRKEINTLFFDRQTQEYFSKDKYGKQQYLKDWKSD